jgi:catechol 2,3-dioxygenase-like lactoylglutathione lyase family enzyme
MRFSSIGAITLFVDDVARARDWYQQTFDLPVAFQDESSAVIEFDNTLLNLLHRGEADTLIGPAPVAAAHSGSEFQFTIWVDDTNDACATLAARGVDLINGPLDRPWGQRTACFADPDGHLWEIAQTIA